MDAILPEIAVRGQGWLQLTEPHELLDFGLALVEATIMTAAIAYHPVSIMMRRSRSEFDVPQTLFTYSLIGMVVGFLIMHHGYLIGFVLFGLGGLLRFRTNEDAGDTMRLILVTLIGLCVGLDLPVIALITTVSAWILIYLFGGAVKFGLEVLFSKKASTTEAMLKLRDRLAELGFQTISMSKTKFKPNVMFVITGPRGIRRSALEREMAKLTEEKGSSIADWHID